MMHKLSDGHYKTLNGSEMWIERDGGRSKVAFDWVEEDSACCDCQAEAYESDGNLIWFCDECGGGQARLHRQF